MRVVGKALEGQHNDLGPYSTAMDGGSAKRFSGTIVADRRATPLVVRSGGRIKQVSSRQTLKQCSRIKGSIRQWVRCYRCCDSGCQKIGAMAFARTLAAVAHLPIGQQLSE